ncbi:APC family permease [uncultured Sphingomonas sp.]|uniref:APC family permease n=1 Tax=uncultured Sphingomonas sp. TaxID=158754 RepID=UPI0035CB5EBC
MAGSTPDPASVRRLPRSIGAAGVVGLTLSALSPAASVYVTGSAILRLAGTGAVPAVIAGGVVILLASLLYAEVGAAFPHAGGIYPGIGAILGPSAARVAIVLGLVSSPALLAFVSLGLADYVQLYAPAWPKTIIVPTLIAAACGIAALNIQISVRITMLLLIVELVALAILVAIGVAHPARSVAQVMLRPVAVGGTGGLVAVPMATMFVATVSGAFACAGSGLALYFADDLTGRPQRIGWLVVIVGIVTVVLVASPLLAICIAMRDPVATLRSTAPIATFISDRAGAGVAAGTVAAVVLAIFNNLVASTIAFGRFLYATGMDGTWTRAVDRRLTTLHPRYGSPVFAIVLLGVAALVACLIGQRALLALLSAEVFTALLVVIAVVVGRRRRLTGIGTFRSPLFPLAPVLGLAVIAAFVMVDWTGPGDNRIAVCALAATASLTFLVSRWASGRAAGGRAASGPAAGEPSSRNRLREVSSQPRS